MANGPGRLVRPLGSSVNSHGDASCAREHRNTLDDWPIAVKIDDTSRAVDNKKPGRFVAAAPDLPRPFDDVVRTASFSRSLGERVPVLYGHCEIG
jgi:hypothetical protein